MKTLLSTAVGCPYGLILKELAKDINNVDKSVMQSKIGSAALQELNECTDCLGHPDQVDYAGEFICAVAFQCMKKSVDARFKKNLDSNR
jgi:hypothetical protein